VLLFAVAATALFPPAPTRAATPAEVEDALGRARKFLYSKQRNGNWEKSKTREKSGDGQDVTGSQFGGLTGLAVLALLSAGENPQDERLAPAIEFLKNADIVGTYALGVRCQVTMMLPQTPETKALMAKDLQRLLGLMKKRGKAQGFYDYDAEGGATTYSLSRSQYAVLGVWAAAQSGHEVPRAYWSTVEKAWIAHQDESGGWNYQLGGRKAYPLTPGMTGVGVATLFITQDQLHASQGVDCKNGPRRAGAIERGIAWMAEHFDQVASGEKYERDYPYATLYAVERIGVAGGLKYFGDVDWYQKGADFLIKNQKKNGSWYGGSGFIGTLPDTCFGMIFLARGRAPVVFNKLNWQGGERAAAGNWNQRPRDVANLTRWVGRAIERDLNWQIVNLDSPLRDLHDAPILYLSGSEAIDIKSEGHLEKLRQYVQGGGMIFAHADCGARAFANTARKLGLALFPGYEFRELPAEHPIYTTLYPRAKWKAKPTVLGLSNGVRELMLLVPQSDLGRTWQLNTVGGKEEGWQFAANVVAYAADQRDLRFKGDTHVVDEAPDAETTRTVRVARLSYKGNWDPEPGGWRRLRNVLRNGDGVDLVVGPVELGAGTLEGFDVAHLTGTSRLTLDEAATEQLKRFVAAGGTLVVDAAGGEEAFATAVEPQLDELVKGGKSETLAPGHPLYAGAEPLRVAYRAAARKSVGKADAPRVKAILAGDRPAVLFSREDLSAGLVGQPVAGVHGYTPAAATELMRRVLLNATGSPPKDSGGARPAKSKPAPKKNPARPARTGG
jgi:hypothetical protein